MRKITGFLNKAFLPFLLIALILSSSFQFAAAFVRKSGITRLSMNRLQKFLESRKGTWHDWNIPYADGKVLYDLVLNQ